MDLCKDRHLKPGYFCPAVDECFSRVMNDLRLILNFTKMVGVDESAHA